LVAIPQAVKNKVGSRVKDKKRFINQNFEKALALANIQEAKYLQIE